MGGADCNNKISWVSWPTVTASKENGGLGIGSLKAFNCALLMKWWWKLNDGNNNIIWKKVINEIHCLHHKVVHHLSKHNLTGVWNNIAKNADDMTGFGLSFNDIFSLAVGDGGCFLFWKDHWIGDTPLYIRFPLLFAIESNNECLIKDRISSNGHSWCWNNNLYDSSTIHELCDLLHLIAATKIKSYPDKLVSNMSPDGRYLAHHARKMIDDKNTTIGYPQMPWVRIVPPKVGCFIWRVGLGRIPVAKCLHDRGVHMVSTLCKVCGTHEEDVDHMMVLCPKAAETWRWIFRWCGIPPPLLSSARGILEFGANWGNCPKKRKMLLTIISGTMWGIWKTRNDLLFNKIHKTFAVIAGEIISTTFLWIKHRGNHSCSWIDWECNPFSVSL